MLAAVTILESGAQSVAAWQRGNVAARRELMGCFARSTPLEVMHEASGSHAVYVAVRR